MLTELLIQSKQIVEQADNKFKRYLFSKINWKNRLIAIKGARGSGKTTLMLQYILENLKLDHTVLYISMEDLYFYDNNLLGLADEFVRNGGKYLFLDEVHKYPDWSREVKLLYDKYKDLMIVYTSSSILELHKASFDLSRRAVVYYLNELSLREYILLSSGVELPVFSLDKILDKHVEIASSINKKIKPIFEFNNYLKHGAYPFFVEGVEEYSGKLLNSIKLVLEGDLPAVYSLEYHNIHKIKKILYAVSTSAPFKPNISKLSERVGVSRPTLLLFLDYLEKADLIYQLSLDKLGISSLAKADKIYMHNSNLLNVFSKNNSNVGSIRETFFLNQTSVSESVNVSKLTDFIVNDKYSFEIGGKNKKQNQIKNIDNSFIVKDNIEFGIGNTIPLWLFGFLY